MNKNMSYFQMILSSKKNRWNMMVSNQMLIGSEIRRKRIQLSITLNDLCEGICSPSYLCKIERNQIVANHVILHEILQKVSFTKEEEDMLFHFYESLVTAMHSYVIKDYRKIEVMIHTASGFDNYRYDILKLIGSIYRHEYYYAYEIYQKLCPLIESMQDADLLIFTAFSAILFYYRKDYKECYCLLSEISDLSLSADLTYLRDKYLFLSSSMQGSYETEHFYILLTDHLSKTGFYDALEEIHYAMVLFSFKSKSESMMKRYLPLLHDEMHKETVSFLIAYFDHDFDALMELDKEKLSPFARHLLSLLNDDAIGKGMISALDDSQNDFDFSSYYLKYQLISGLADKKRYISECLKHHRTEMDYFTVKYFIIELAYLSEATKRYRAAVKVISGYFAGL